MTKKKDREIRPFQFDPSVFRPGPKRGFLERHFLGRMRSLGKYTLYALAFSYPIILVSLGVMFGGLVFWASLVGSIAILGLVIKKAGYAGNFAGWGVGYKGFIGLIGAFVIVLALYYGLLYTPMGAWTIPIFGGVIAIIFILGFWKISNR